MKWFEGNIPEAISAAKSRNAIFVVYVHDSSEASKTTDEALGQKDISSALGSDNFVAIQLENGTEGAKQFSQIYPLVLVPSLFFISGQTGIPLEVLGGPLTVDNLQLKLKNLAPSLEQTDSVSVDVGEQVTTACETFQPNTKSDQQEEQNEVETNDENLQNSVNNSTEELELPSASKNEDLVESGSANKNEENALLPDDTGATGLENTSTCETSTENSLDEKVERAKFLLAQKQAKIAQEKADEERRKEIERRKMGQEIAKKKQQQEDEELRAAARERKKDKEEDRLARERVKAQIAADRAEREAHVALLRGEQIPTSQGTPPAATASSASSSGVSHNSISRLKFRLPDGSSSIAQFPAEATLSEVFQHIEQNVQLPFSNFNLGSTVHSGPFTPDDYNTSLRDLGLVPSAIMVILPASSGSSGRVVASGGIWDILWILLSPISFLFGLVRQYLNGGSGPRTPPSPDEPEAKRPRDGSGSNQRPTTAHGRRGETRLRQEGNIHRLGNNDEEDDDNNTWNGNSTQQM